MLNAVLKHRVFAERFINEQVLWVFSFRIYLNTSHSMRSISSYNCAYYIACSFTDLDEKKLFVKTNALGKVCFLLKPICKRINFISKWLKLKWSIVLRDLIMNTWVLIFFGTNDAFCGKPLGKSAIKYDVIRGKKRFAKER